jgi:hypothetical protein
MDQRSVSDYSFVEGGPGEAKDLPIQEGYRFKQVPFSYLAEG